MWMSYRYRKLQELAWAALVSAVTAALMIFVNFDPENIPNWKTWVVSIGAGMVRAAAGAVIATLTNPVRNDPVQAAEKTLESAVRTVVAVEQAVEQAEQSPEAKGKP